MKFTEETIAQIIKEGVPACLTESIVFDDDIAGFGLRMRKGGSRKWIFQYRIGAKQRRMTFGTYPAMKVAAARAQAKTLHAKTGLKNDPAGEKAENVARGHETFKNRLDLYLEHRLADKTLRASSYREIKRHLDVNVKALHELRIDKITKRDVAGELSRFTINNGPIQANRTRASLIKFLKWCAGEGFVETNVAAFTNKNGEVSRTRVLEADELRAIWRVLDNMGDDYRDIARLLALTGQRKSEIGDLKWDQISFNKGLIMLPATVKNGTFHLVPMSAPVRTILESCKRTERDFVFGTGEKRGFNGWSKALKAARKAAKVKEHWTLHDLRRTCRTGLSEIGVLPHVGKAVLNHAGAYSGDMSAGSEPIYDRWSYLPEKTAALEDWGEHLIALIERRASNVAALRRARKQRAEAAEAQAELKQVQ